MSQANVGCRWQFYFVFVTVNWYILLLIFREKKDASIVLVRKSQISIIKSTMRNILIIWEPKETHNRSGTRASEVLSHDTLERRSSYSLRKDLFMYSLVCLSDISYVNYI